MIFNIPMCLYKTIIIINIIIICILFIYKINPLSDLYFYLNLNFLLFYILLCLVILNLVCMITLKMITMYILLVLIVLLNGMCYFLYIYQCSYLLKMYSIFIFISLSIFIYLFMWFISLISNQMVNFHFFE